VSYSYVTGGGAG